MQDTVVLDGELSLLIKGNAKANLITEVSGEAGIFTAIREGYPAYTGQTVVTPSLETQTLRTAQKSVLTDITIEPIPNYYGLITWDGSTLTVS